MNISTKEITFLRDIHSSIKLDMTSRWRYHYFDGSIYELAKFIKLIGDDKIYLLIPIFIDTESKPQLILSEPFLVNNKSNPALIIKFILEQWDSSGFRLREGTIISYSFKFKRIWTYYK
jgi:hypothetical protein